VLAIHFTECKHFFSAQKGVAAAKQTALTKPVPGEFRVWNFGHSVIFFFSETPRHPTAVELFGKISTAVQEDLNCYD
jgi:hypothetical protein